ncbi:hypothetical protein [Streptomyces sp. NPDC058595]|uniref:hypothetical protein n=1 Tax=Streptomyces sp. NPDC058595 TaxID=3346550 RepID=UPI00364A512D
MTPPRVHPARTLAALLLLGSLAIGCPATAVKSATRSATRPQLGEELLRCVGTAKKEHGMQAIPCDMTGGSSGGPWPADFDTTTGKGVLVSVNASLDALTPAKMYGEVLGATEKKVFDRAQNS